MKIVYGKHRRWFSIDDGGAVVINPKGGYTVMAVEHDDGDITWGMAVCSMKDNFCKRTGRNIAVGRARQARERGKTASFPSGREQYEEHYRNLLPEWVRERVYGGETIRS